ncbi:hypothetical protein BS47DRAFT_1353401 [Hydnum rufescens UP504]|uniref:G domain-containing protein n=1 Tax=Hydnum rufescens UP504 TaxID=1448309 RepID=A0A9P6AJH7_9AGAM|nr:hypothetical protein BS47DRAFT_1353401 [Hydnum rufescens UP504]
MWKSIRKHFKLPNKLTKKGFIKKAVPGEQVPDEQNRVTRRFRVLILGPANAGKTTLLERLTDSPAGASIVTRNGKRIEEVPRGYDQASCGCLMFSYHPARDPHHRR